MTLYLSYTSNRRLPGITRLVQMKSKEAQSGREATSSSCTKNRGDQHSMLAAE